MEIKNCDDILRALYHGKATTTSINSHGIQRMSEMSALKDTPPIAVAVGEGKNKTTWHLPKAQLTRYSTFFGAALNGDFVEANTKTVLLPEVKPHIFELFVQWLYLGTCNAECESSLRVGHYGAAWILGDQLGCAAFQDFAMLNSIKTHQEFTIGRPLMDLAYRNTPSSSKLRRWMVAHYLDERYRGLSEQSADWTPDDEGAETSEFMEDVGRLAAKKGLKGFEDPYKNPYLFLEVVTKEMVETAAGANQKGN